MGFPIRKFTDQSLFAAPHDLSQRTTSFIASQRQGIHRMPLRHLIALIANARRSTRDLSKQASRLPLKKVARPFDLGGLRTLPFMQGSGWRWTFSKRPVLLQTHPGALAVKPEPTTETLSGPRRKPKARSLRDRTLPSPRPLDRTRFLFTMS